MRPVIKSVIYQSPNHGVSRLVTKGVILHSTRSGVSTGSDRLSREFDRTINYFMMPAAQASAHYVIGYDEGQVAQMVVLDYMAWHAGPLNTEYLGIEFTQPTIHDEYSQWQLDCGREVLRSLSKLYGFALNRETILRHQDTEQGKFWGKSDPGDLLNVAYLLG